MKVSEVFTLTDDDKERMMEESAVTDDDDDRNEDMVEVFAAQSWMNMEWARKYLIEFYGDYCQSIYKFSE
jgi:NACalpha-BTF3-like transcription factor